MPSARSIGSAMAVILICFLVQACGGATGPQRGHNDSIDTTKTRFVSIAEELAFLSSDSSTHRVFAASLDGHVVYPMDGRTAGQGAVTQPPPISIDGSITGMGLSADQRRLYVSDEYGARVIDADSLQIMSYQQFGKDQGNMYTGKGRAVHAYSGGAYVMSTFFSNDYQDYQVASRIGPEGPIEYIAKFPKSACPEGVNYDTGELYVGNGSNLQIVNPDGSIKSGSLPDPNIVKGVVDPKKRTLIGVDSSSTLIALHDDGRVEKVALGQDGFVDPYLDLRNRRIYVPNPKTKQIAILNAESFQTLTTAKVHATSVVAVDSAAKLLYMAGSGGISIDELPDT